VPRRPAFAPLRALTLTVLAMPAWLRAQDTVRVTPLTPVDVVVSREGPRTPLELPFALTRLVPDSSRPALRRAAIGDLLFAVPGVQVQDRANPSQDPRLSIRGFGARSAFGVRGVRVVRDGVPLTLPDGQTPIDWLDLESAGAFEVVRGTAAALYGNAGGGVLSVQSRDPSRAPVAAQLRAWDGGGVRRASMLASGSLGGDGAASLAPSWLASVTRTAGDGNRQWARQEAVSVFARGTAQLRGTRLEAHVTHYDAARAENPGALTADELARDPSLADSLNIVRGARKAVVHSQLALSATRGTSDREVGASLFAGTRQLDNPLAFAIVGVDRRNGGGSLRGHLRSTRTPWPVRLAAGIDAQWQRDDRGNWENCVGVTSTSTRCPVAGAERGAVRLDQQEDADGVGAYARAEVEAPGRVFASVALRGDEVRFRVRDRFVTGANADDSGDRRLSALTPMAGVVWRARPLWSLYANVATAFETPTVTELTNQPDGAAGLNQALAPQRTRTVEAGVHGWLASRLRLDLSAFAATVTDELVPFDVPGAPGRRAFRNAGRTSRRGLEASGIGVLPAGEAGVSYTWSRFRFEDYAVGEARFDGNPIPGIPAHQLQAYATGRWRGWFATAEATAASEVTANDAATVAAAGFAVWSLRLGRDGGAAMGGGLVRVEPMVGVDNLFDRRYASAIVANATRGRFFEPGAPRRLYAGARVAYR
jgi:iron complex outermembrane receptor protein